jgi:hypothetical protein
MINNSGYASDDIRANGFSRRFIESPHRGRRGDEERAKSSQVTVRHEATDVSSRAVKPGPAARSDA